MSHRRPLWLRSLALIALAGLLAAGCGAKPAPTAGPAPKAEAAPDSVPGFLYVAVKQGEKETLWRMRANGTESAKLAADLPVLTRLLPAKGFVLADTKDGLLRITAGGAEPLKLPSVQWRGVLETEPDRAYVVSEGSLYAIEATGDPKPLGKANRLFGGYGFIALVQDQENGSVLSLLEAGMNGKPQELLKTAKGGEWVWGPNLLGKGQKYLVPVQQSAAGGFTSYVIDLAARKATAVPDTYLVQLDDSRALAFKPFQNKPGRTVSLASPTEAGKVLDSANPLWTNLAKQSFGASYGPFTGASGLTFWADEGKGAMSSYALFPDQDKVVRIGEPLPQGDELWKNRVGDAVLQLHLAGKDRALDAAAVTATGAQPVKLPAGLTLAGTNDYPVWPSRRGFVGLFQAGKSAQVGLITPSGYAVLASDTAQVQVGFAPSGDYFWLIYAAGKNPADLYVARESDAKTWKVMAGAALAYWTGY